MSENPGSKDKSLETLDFIINVLKEHEKNLDNDIDELTTVADQIGNTKDGIKDKVEELEEKVSSLQKELFNLLQCISNAPKNSLLSTEKERSLQFQAAPAIVSSAFSERFKILRCIQWEDFQLLAIKAQTLTFSCKETEKIFQVDALKGNQIITYEGVTPSFSTIVKEWLCLKLDVKEENILEGFLDKLK